jgi:hypothetical protein
VLRAFWTGAFLSEVGASTETAAIGICVTRETGQAGWNGLVAAAGFLLGGLPGPVGGAPTDGSSRTDPLQGHDVVRACAG